MTLTEREKVQFGPRDMKEKGSPEWCLQTLEYLKIRWAKKEDDVQVLAGVLQEIEEAKAWETVPQGSPYGSLDALLKAELGVGEPEVKGTVNRLEQTQRAAQATTGDVLPPRKPKLADKLSANSQPQRARRNSVSEATQRKLDTLAREHKDLHARICAGKMSVNAAWIAAGRAVATFNCPKEPAKAAAAIRRHFTAEERAAIKELL